MAHVIERHLDVLEEAAAALPGDVIARRDTIEELIDVSLEAMRTLQRRVSRWKDAVAAGRARADVQDSREFWDLYARHHRLLESLAPAIEEVQTAGFILPNADEFEQARIDAGLVVSVPLEEALAAEKNYQRGAGRTLAEVRDGLRGRAQSGG